MSLNLLFEKQSLTVLAVAHGAVVSIEDNFNLGLEFQALIASCRLLLKKAGKDWPLDPKLNVIAMPWVRERLARWTKANPHVDEGWRIMSLLAMATTAITDRYEASEIKASKARLDSEKAYYQKQMALLDPIFEALDALVIFIRDEGMQNEVVEETARLLKTLYKELEIE